MADQVRRTKRRRFLWFLLCPPDQYFLLPLHRADVRVRYQLVRRHHTGLCVHRTDYAPVRGRCLRGMVLEWDWKNYYVTQHTQQNDSAHFLPQAPRPVCVCGYHPVRVWLSARGYARPYVSITKGPQCCVWQCCQNLTVVPLDQLAVPMY